MLRKFLNHPLIVKVSHYFGANLATQALGFLTVPLYTRLLTEADYGIVNVFSSLVTILIPIATFNLHTGVARYYYEEKSDFKEFFGTSVIATFFCIGVISVLMVLFKDQLIHYLNIPKNLYFYILLAIFFTIPINWFNGLYIAKGESKKVMYFNMATSYSKAMFSTIFIVFVSSTFYWKITGELISMCIIFLTAIFYLKNEFKLTFKKIHLNYAIKFGVPLIPYALSGVILTHFDRIYINKQIGNEQAGLYSLAYNIGILLYVFGMATINATNPDFYKMMNQNDLIGVKKQSLQILKLIFLAGGFLLLFSPSIGLVLAGERYKDSLLIIPIIVIGYLFWVLYQLNARSIFYLKNTFWLSIITLFAGGVNIALNAYFIPKYGYKAAAYTTMASYFLMMIIILFLNEAKFKLRQYNYKKVLVLFVGTLVLYCISHFFTHSMPLMGLKALTIKVITFIVILLFLYMNQLKDLVNE